MNPEETVGTLFRSANGLLWSQPASAVWALRGERLGVQKGEHGRDAGAAEARARLVALSRDVIKDVIAGLVASIVLIGNIVSFGALMFPGDLSAGIPVAIWSMLVGGCIGGVWIALTTSLPPLATGIDSPTGAVLVLLSALTASAVRAAGGSPQMVIESVMLVFTTATLLSGAVLYALGACRWGSYFRFVPYPVVGGFLAATGYFLIAGAVRMTAGPTAFTLAGLASWTAADVAKLAAAVLVLGVMVALRRWVKAPFAMPATLIVMWLASVAALRMVNLSEVGHGWYLPSLGTLSTWLPFRAVRTSHLDWPMLAHLAPELLAVMVVALISLVTKVSSIEVGRQAAGDLDREFRGHGIGSLIAAPFGGLTSSLQVGTSGLLQHAGSGGRLSGVVCALALGLVALVNLDLPGFVPIPIVAGLVLFLGYAFIVDALWKPFAQRAWLDLVLSAAIMIVCIKYGYLVGVLTGVACACLLFVASYARLGVVRRHLTRVQFPSRADRSGEASAHLRSAGEAVQLYWLSGYIFFGSSEGLFERIRGDIAAALPRRVAYVILDFSMVSGADSSAYVSLAKLRNYCNQQGTTIVYCALPGANLEALKRRGFIGGKNRHRAFADLDTGLAWCEDKLLAEGNIEVGMNLAGFPSWLQRQLGPDAKSDDLIAYFDRRHLDDSTVLHRQGEPADTIDIVAAGRLAVDVATSSGGSLRVRRTTSYTVVGEMGFFRVVPRAATVSSEGPADLFTLTRANFERMRRERPDLANAFGDFIIRIMSDRIDSANREIAALEPVTG
jgi:sulfate permease, SulP family